MRGACQASHAPGYLHCSKQQLCHLISHNSAAVVVDSPSTSHACRQQHSLQDRLATTFFSFRADLRDVTGRTTANSVLSHPVGLTSTTYFTFFLKGLDSPRYADTNQRAGSCFDLAEPLRPVDTIMRTYGPCTAEPRVTLLNVGFVMQGHANPDQDKIS